MKLWMALLVMLFPKSSKNREWIKALRNQNEGKAQGVLISLYRWFSNQRKPYINTVCGT